MSEKIDNSVTNEIVDLEKVAQDEQELPDHECHYRIKIDGEYFLIDEAIVTGQKILSLVGKSPPRFKLILRAPKGGSRPVGPEESLDLSKPGIERFNTLACDQTEGEAPRRQFHLGGDDLRFLESLEHRWETVVEGANRWLIIRGLALPEGYNHEQADVAVQIPPGYPDTQLDMAFFFPPIARVDGKQIGATSASVNIGGANYQRWSRHRTAENPWRPGIDNLATHFHLVVDWLQRELQQ